MNQIKHPIVCIHGDLQNHTVFASIEQFMKSQGHQTYAFDMPGHGLTPVTKEEDLLQWLKQMLEEHTIKQPILIGNSSGGTLALQYALQEKVAGLLLINAPLGNPAHMNPAINWEEGYKAFLNKSKSLFEKQALVDYTSLTNAAHEQISIQGFKTTHPEGFEKNLTMYRSLPNMLDIHKLNIPIVLLYATSDPYIPQTYPVNAQKLCQNALLQLMEGSHHILLQNPQEVLSLLKKNYLFLVGQ